MAGLDDFRKQHPEYNDLSDQMLGDKLYQKFYSDMPRQEFDAKVLGTPNVGSGAQGTDSSPLPQSFGDTLSNMAGSFVNNLTAGMQRTSPITLTLEGNKPYGDPIVSVNDVHENDSGGYSYVGPDGYAHDLDPKKHVMLQGPDGKFYIYNRSPKTDESILPSLGRIASMGFAAAPLAVSNAAKPAVTGLAKTVPMFERQNIPPSLATATDSRATAFAHNTLKDFWPSAGVVEGRDINQLRAAANQAENLAGQYGKGATPIDAGAALKSGAQSFVEAAPSGLGESQIMLSPTRMSSFSEKAEKAYGRVDKLIPESATVDMTGTVGAFDDVASRFNLEELGQKFQDPKLAVIGNILKKNGSVLTWNDAKNLRTEIGKLLSKPVVVSDIDRGQLKNIYAALSEDMGRTAAAASPEAANAWKTANAYYNAGLSRINDAVSKIIGAPSDEGAYNLLMKSTQAGKQTENAKRLVQIRRSMSDDQWGDVASTVIRQMGKPSAGLADPSGKFPDFSAAQFVTRYEGLSDTAKSMLFDGAGRGNLRSALDEFVNVLGRIKNAERLQNTSRTASGVNIFGTAAALMASPAKAVVGLLGANMTARAMTNPAFVRWLAQAAQIKTPQQMASQVARLSQLARLDKSLSDIAETLRQGLPAVPADQNEGQDRQQQ